MKKKNGDLRSSVLSKTDYCIKNHLLKDFSNEVNKNDFERPIEYISKNFGYLGDVIRLYYKKKQDVMYFLKIFPKTNLRKEVYANKIDLIFEKSAYYKLNDYDKSMGIYDYIINLQTAWEDETRLFLIFDGIKRYNTLEYLLKKNINTITEDNILIIYRQILESVNFLHKNNLFGCVFNLNSFIYDNSDSSSIKIKLTDLGFSQILKNEKNIYDNKLQNGFLFNDYAPPEFLSKMSESSNFKEKEKFYNLSYDLWRLGILFFKIASFGESPYNNLKNEELKESILKGNINYSKLNKYSNQIIQIIDKFLQFDPSKRKSINEIFKISIFNIDNKNLVIDEFNDKFKEENIITMSKVNQEKKKLIKEGKISLTSTLDYLYNKKRLSKNDIKDKDKNILSKFKLLGKLMAVKSHMEKQEEIIPDESVLPVFKNKLLNKFKIVDENLILELSSKLNSLEKEYKKLDENKTAIQNISNYVNTNIKDFDNDGRIKILLNEFNELRLQSKPEIFSLYEEILKSNNGFENGEKCRSLINHLVFENKKLDNELESEKMKKENLQKKLKEQEKKINQDNAEHHEIVEFYEAKIEFLENVVFTSEEEKKKSLQKNNNKKLYNDLENSIKDFTNINIKLKENLDKTMEKFINNKKEWLGDMINAKENFQKEISINFDSSNEMPKRTATVTSNNILTLNKENEKDEEIKKLKEEIEKKWKLINEQKNSIINNTNMIKDYKKELKIKDDRISSLNNKLINSQK